MKNLAIWNNHALSYPRNVEIPSKIIQIHHKLYIFFSFFTELTPGCDRQVSWIKDQTLVDQTNANNIEQGRVQFSIVEAGPRDSGLYELLTVYNGEEHRAAFAINVL